MEASHSSPAPKRKISRSQVFKGLGILTVIALIVGGWYWIQQQKYIYTDKAEIAAPLIELAPTAPGILMRVSVNEGDLLNASESVARVGDEIVSTQVAGQAVVVKKDVGAAYQPGEPVVTMIEPKELKVVARIEEDKGLRNIQVGQDVSFTVDAFGSHKYHGTVESISPTKREGDVVFSISDKREEKEFDVKIDYDHQEYPELQNGMSARVWIIK